MPSYGLSSDKPSMSESSSPRNRGEPNSSDSCVQSLPPSSPPSALSLELTRAVFNLAVSGSFLLLLFVKRGKGRKYYFCCSRFLRSRTELPSERRGTRRGADSTTHPGYLAGLGATAGRPSGATRDAPKPPSSQTAVRNGGARGGGNTRGRRTRGRWSHTAVRKAE